MHRFWAVGALTLLLFAGAPLAHASTPNLPLFNPSFHIVPNPTDLGGNCVRSTDALGFGGVLQLTQNILNTGVSLAVLLFIAMIVYAGVLFLFAPTNPESVSTARKVFFSTILGAVIVCSAWLAIDFVMKQLYAGESGNSPTGWGPWNQILSGGDACIEVNANQNPLFSGNIFAVPNVQMADGTVTVSDGPATGDCSATALAQDWGSVQRGQLFACIINNESQCHNILNIPTARDHSSAGGRYQVLASTGQRGNAVINSIPECPCHHSRLSRLLL